MSAVQIAPVAPAAETGVQKHQLDSYMARPSTGNAQFPAWYWIAIVILFLGLLGLFVWWWTGRSNNTPGPSPTPSPGPGPSPSPSPSPSPTPAPAPTNQAIRVTSASTVSGNQVTAICDSPDDLIVGCSHLQSVNYSALPLGSEFTDQQASDSSQDYDTRRRQLQCVAYGSHIQSNSPTIGAYATCASANLFDDYQIVEGDSSGSAEGSVSTAPPCPSGYVLMGCTGKTNKTGSNAGLQGAYIGADGTCQAYNRGLDGDRVRASAMCVKPKTGTVLQFQNVQGNEAVPTCDQNCLDTLDIASGTPAENCCKVNVDDTSKSAAVCPAGTWVASCGYSSDVSRQAGSYTQTDGQTCMAIPSLNGTSPVVAQAHCVSFAAGGSS
jgi:hypothetical protein